MPSAFLALIFIFLLSRAYETLSDAKKRKVYDMTGMSAEEQQGADVDFDQMNSVRNLFTQLFKGGHPTDEDDTEAQHKSYEQILEEYERFFSLD